MLRGIQLDLAHGDLHAVLGPSGCGKSTLLKCLAGMKAPDRGRVLVDGRDVTEEAPHRRGIVLLHQEDTLFPHLTVEGNVAFAPRLRREAPARARERVRELLDLVGLAGYEARRTSELSGGQRQRVALARALAADPQVLLLDEPLSHVDQPLRVALRVELRRILRRVGITALYVTHDKEEAFSVADTLILLDEGRVLDAGDGPRVFGRPRTPAAARLLGRRNLIRYERTPTSVRTPLGDLDLALPPEAAGSGVLMLAEEDLGVTADGPGIPVRIESEDYLGGRYRFACSAGAAIVWVEQADRDGLVSSQPARLDLSRARPVFWADAR